MTRPTRRESIQIAALLAFAASCRPSSRVLVAGRARACPPDREGPAFEDGYRLWLRYEPVSDSNLLASYRAHCTEAVFEAPAPTLSAARRELDRGLTGLLGIRLRFADRPTQAGTLIVGTPKSSPTIAALGWAASLAPLGREGFAVRGAVVNGGLCTIVAANEDVGVLYGVFHLLRQLQTQRAVNQWPVESAPKLPLRMLDHWDNLDRTVERGYAGFSIWNWQELPDVISPQYEDYARANASIGINATVLTNVNADALVLTEPYLAKVAALANVFRPYGIRVYVTARFSAPIEIGGLATADPLDPAVAAFWRDRVAEIYRRIPDFGGFLVKANSEGQPGPQEYRRTHADGANVLADALAPRGGTVVWRAFVYANQAGADRAKQAYEEFVPLDGMFRSNVLLQVKNGPIDFQPREPFHPLFGAMKATPLVMEFQITQEYLGFATHLVFLATLFQEALESDTFARGRGSTVAKVLEGAVEANGRPGGMAGVANIGTDRNWCGHPFAQANWFAFGRLAWDPTLTAEAIADEWIPMTFTSDERFVTAARSMMLGSREAAVDYMTPLGLHHIMAADHHYGPGPWTAKGRADWTAVYYHRADAAGLGFDRSVTGSNAVAQYASPLRETWGAIDTCPENLLLWFHHVAWDRRMRSGRTLWEELCQKYDVGVGFVREMRRQWSSLEGTIDPNRYRQVRELLGVQEREARWWRDACLLYFQTFSRQPFPKGAELPEHALDYYLGIHNDYVPGIRSPRRP